MKYHPLARTTVYLWEQLAKAVLEGGLSLNEAAAEFKLSRQSAGKWVKRYRELGVEGLADRSSRPHRLPTQTSPEVVLRVEQMRRVYPRAISQMKLLRNWRCRCRWLRNWQ